MIGGTAAVIAGATHVTFNLDITPASEVENLDRVAGALRRLNAKPFGLPPEAPRHFQLDGTTLAGDSAWKFIIDQASSTSRSIPMELAAMRISGAAPFVPRFRA